MCIYIYIYWPPCRGPPPDINMYNTGITAPNPFLFEAIQVPASGGSEVR